MESTQNESDWQKTQYANLVRYKPSKIFFARVRVGGKLIRRSMKTKSVTVAKGRLDELVKQERATVKLRSGIAAGKLTVGDAIKMFKLRMNGDQSLKPRTKAYYEERVTALLKSWPDLERQDVGKVTKTQCLQWAAEFGAKYSANAFNHTVSILKQVFEIGKEVGARYDNPADAIKWIPAKQKALQLPSSTEFAALVNSVRHAGGGFSRHCADLILFLAYGGFRKGEAANILWKDVQMNADGTGTIHVRGDAETGTKNSETRYVPIIPDMHQLLQRLLNEADQPSANAPVMRVNECQKAIDSAVERLAEGELDAEGNKLPSVIVPRITHHDLRHLFATRCIESGVDIPTVARWLGHKDGGALAMRTYGHLRQEHSMSMASKVRFQSSQANAIVSPADSSSRPVEESIHILNRNQNPPELLATA